MGHLGNPVGFRLGFQKLWQNCWFIKNLYYPEYINDMLNIRDYLYYYMTRSEMLKSGFCLSHFFLYKMQKNYYIKIYLYQIDLEKLSYEYINKAFFNYYEVYNQAIKRPFSKRNKMIVSYFRDLSNADLYVFYSSFFCFIHRASYKNKKPTLLRDNIYLKESLIIDYSYTITLDYINIIVSKLKSYFSRVGNKIWRKEKILSKQKFRKTFKKACKILSNFTSKKKWTEDDLNTLEYCLKKIYKKKIKKVFFYFFFNMRKKLQRNLNILFKVSKFKVRNTFADIFFNYKINNFERRNLFELKNKIYKKKYNVKFIDLFFYLAKKVGFQKVRNSYSLKRKWFYLYKYLKIFNKIQYHKKKFNLKSFFFFISLFIYASAKLKTRRLHFNFKKGTYLTMYVGIAKEFFVDILKLVSMYIKYIITILCNKIQFNNIFLIYYFMTNKNVTSQLISRYIALKLKKNFTLIKTLNPLRRELKRLSKGGRTSKRAYIHYNYKYLFNKNKTKIRRTIKVILKSYRKYFYFNYYKYFINKGFLIYFNTFIYHKFYAMYYSKSKKKNNIKYISFFKAFYINFYYQIILNLYKGVKITLKNKKNIVYYNFSKIYNIFIPLKYKKKLNSKTKLIYISSYFYKNIINFKLISFIWASFKNFNVRNIRQEYIPKFKSILMGYKMAFRGRFSRKQRASFVWTQIGKAPLNTISIYIDYTFFTIPLKNSAVSIKIWLYKNKSFMKFKYLLKV